MPDTHNPHNLSNAAIAAVFTAIADSMDILGEDRFRTSAYRRAGEALADLPRPLADYRARGELEDIPGVGRAIADKVVELLDTGHLQFYEKLRARVPSGVLALLRIPGLGARTVARLYEEHGIASVDDLRTALESGKLTKVKGITARTITTIKESLDAAALEPAPRRLMFDALRTADALLAALPDHGPVTEAAVAGSIRRGVPTVSDINLVAASNDPAALLAAFAQMPQVAEVVEQTEQRVRALLQNGMHADLVAVEPARYGTALQERTGSLTHNARLAELLAARNVAADTTFTDEAARYAAAGSVWVPPELRDDSRFLDAPVPAIIALGDMRADLHMHSVWSDGRAPIRVMAEAARARGYSHMAITDHGAYLGITNGLDGTRLLAQAEEVAALNAEYVANGIDFRILCGVEVDITPDGELALSDVVLARLDIVVASPHVSLRQPPDKATERLLRAIRNPHVDIIGHPTGRLLNARAGSPIDIDVIAQAAAEHGTLLEVNSGPDRLDLDGTAVQRVLELGARITINSDSHHPDNLPWIRLGVQQARRGGATPAQVANTWSLAELVAWLRQRGTENKDQ